VNPHLVVKQKELSPQPASISWHSISSEQKVLRAPSPDMPGEHPPCQVSRSTCGLWLPEALGQPVT